MINAFYLGREWKGEELFFICTCITWFVSSWMVLCNFGGLLLIWFHFDPNMDNGLHTLWSVGWSYLSISKFQRRRLGLSHFILHIMMYEIIYQ